MDYGDLNRHLSIYLSITGIRTGKDGFLLQRKPRHTKIPGFWIEPPKIPCHSSAPGGDKILKFSGNMPILVLRKVRKFQKFIANRFGDIIEKP